jgi:hypothetical protein
MRNLVKVAIIAILVIMAVSWLTTTAFGHDNDSLQLNAAAAEGPVITPAPLADAPAVTFFGNAIGTVTPGDLFYIDSSNVSMDLEFTLYLTNADQLTPSLAYLHLNIAVYRETTPGQWEKLQTPDQFLTMQNGHVAFILPGMANHKIVISGGCYKTHALTTASGAAPVFYLEAAVM